MADKMYPTDEIETMRAAVAAYDTARAPLPVFDHAINDIGPDGQKMEPKSPISEMMTREAKAIMDGKAPPLVNPMMVLGSPYASDTMLVQDVPGGMTAAVPPAYKNVQLRFGDAAVTLNGDGSLGGDLDAFTAALETINPAADDVAFAVGWLVARVESMERALEAHRTLHREEVDCNALRDLLETEPDRDVGDDAPIVTLFDPDPGDADPSEPPAEEMFPEGRAQYQRRVEIMTGWGKTMQPWEAMPPEIQASWQRDAERVASGLSERATHEAAQQRDYNA